MRGSKNRVIERGMVTPEFWQLSAVSDEHLLQNLNGLLAAGARAEAHLVAHLAEGEERRLHLKAATPSLFEYCLRRLGLSESEAFHRITAARLARKFPVIFGLLEARAIHLSALRVLRLGDLMNLQARSLPAPKKRGFGGSPPLPNRSRGRYAPTPADV